MLIIVVQVTGLSWNDLGTVLLSAGDNGKVFLWMGKLTELNSWQFLIVDYFIPLYFV